jgi:hypothetical protein
VLEEETTIDQETALVVVPTPAVVALRATVAAALAALGILVLLPAALAAQAASGL